MDKRDTQKAILLIMALFCAQPMALGAWLAMIPYIKETLGLSKSELAVALLGMPVALIPALQVASWIVARIGIRRTFAYLLPVQAAAVLLPFGAWSVGSLFAALAAFGCVVAFMEVALNTYAGRLEKSQRVLIMSRCHGFWALGVGIGSFLASQMFGLGALVAILLISSVSSAAGVLASLRLPRLVGQDDAKTAKPQSVRQMPKRLFLIALFVLLVSLCEGAMSEWGAVYLAERWGGPVNDAGIAVTVFAGFLAAGRFTGDYMKRRLGAQGVARLTVCLAMAGIIALTATDSVAMTFVGFALMGLGVSIGFPLGISAAAALDDTHEAQNIATTSMIGICAFLIGPPLIGFAADAFSLRAAFLGLFPALMIAFWLTRYFPIKESSAESA